MNTKKNWVTSFLSPNHGALDWTRTSGLQSRSLSLIQLGYKRIFGFTLWCDGAPCGGRCAAIRKTAGALRAGRAVKCEKLAFLGREILHDLAQIAFLAADGSPTGWRGSPKASRSD